jgi:nucleotide-binding universal stress UspA family protein
VASGLSPTSRGLLLSSVRTGPIVIGYDGSEAAEHALTDAAALLAPRAFLALELAAATPSGIPPAPIDVRTAIEVDAEMGRQAQRAAERGAQLASKAGLDAKGLAVADDLTVADTLVRLARERDAQALVLGAHGHGPLSEAILGSTSRDVTRKAPCPVLVSPPSAHDGRDSEHGQAQAPAHGHQIRRHSWPASNTPAASAGPWDPAR